MALAATRLGVLRLRAQDRTLPLPCACQVCEEWTDGPYCTLCNVTDGSRYYKESRCLPCAEGLLADLLWKVAVIAAGIIALIIFLNRCKCWEKTKWLQKMFLKGVVMYGQLDMRAKFKQYATHASNPWPADGPRQVCHLNTCAPRLGRAVTFYQIATKIESVYVLSLPPEVSALLQLFHVAFAINVDSFGLPLGCLSLATFYNKLIFMMIAPLVRSP